METKAVGVADLTHAELYELVFQLKQCNESAPEEMRRLLQEQPEFARAIAQAQLKLGMVRERQDDSTNAPANAVVTNQILRLQGCVGTSDSSLLMCMGNLQQGVSNDLMEKLDPEQQELLEQVQNLAPEVIQSLPPEERRQIMELREAMGLPPV